MMTRGKAAAVGLSTVTAMITLSGPAVAGGLYLAEIGTRDAGFASAGWAARAEDAGTIASNPAGLARLTQPELIVGLQPLYADIQFKPDASTTTSGPDGDASGLIPSGSLFYARPVNDRWAWGIGVYGNFGSKLDYESDWVGRYYVDDVTLQALVVQPTVSWRINDRWSVGAGLMGVYAIFEEKIRVRNLSPGEGDGLLKLDDEQVEWAANFGVLFEPSSRTRIGLQYVMETELGFEDQPEFRGIGPLLDAVLERNGLKGATLGLEMNYPNALMLSGFHQLDDRWAILGNVGWQQWSEFGKVSVTLSAEDQTTLVADRNYDDTWHVAAGAEYRVSDPWRISFGMGYDSSMVKDKYRTPDLPVGEQWRFGFGAEYAKSDRFTITGTYTLIWGGDLSMSLDRGPLAGKVEGEYDGAAVHTVGVVFRWMY